MFVRVRLVVIVLVVLLTVTALRTMLRVVAVLFIRTVITIGAVDMFRCSVGMFVCMSVYDLGLWEQFFAACAFREAKHSVGVGADFFDIVSHHQDRDLFFYVQVMEDVQEAVYRFCIYADCRLIEDQDFRVCRKYPREHDPLLLAAGKFADQGFALVFHAYEFQGFLDLLLVGFLGEARKSDILVLAAHDDFFACCREGGRAVATVLRQVSYAASLDGLHFLAADPDRTRCRTIHAKKKLDHSAFANAVVADHDGEITFLHGEIHVFQDHFPGVPERHIFYFNYFRHTVTSLVAGMGSSLCAVAAGGAPPHSKDAFSASKLSFMTEK